MADSKPETAPRWFAQGADKRIYRGEVEFSNHGAHASSAESWFYQIENYRNYALATPNVLTSEYAMR